MASGYISGIWQEKGVKIRRSKKERGMSSYAACVRLKTSGQLK